MTGLIKRIPNWIWAVVVTVVVTPFVFSGLYAFCLFMALVFIPLEDFKINAESAAFWTSIILTVLIVTEFARRHAGHWIESLTNSKHRHD